MRVKIDAIASAFDVITSFFSVFSVSSVVNYLLEL